MKRSRPVCIASALLAAGALVGLAACTTAGSDAVTTPSEGHLSRVRTYASVRELANDSALIVVASTKSEKVAADIDGITDFTLASVTVDEVVKGPESLTVGGSLVVRQTGSASQTAPVPLLKIGSKYLLYLTPSGLDGDKASQYYVTGANAGVYAAGSDREFRQVQRQAGEELPASIARDNARG